MKYDVSDSKTVVAGYVLKVEKKSDSLVVVSIANNKGHDDMEWVNVAFCKPQAGKQGRDLASLASKYVVKGQYLTVVANKVVNGDYENYYASVVELGPKPSANGDGQKQSK